jgi:DNA invertase Pin-like site-specific DNA recombinase
MSKSEKIRQMLQRGKSPSEIAAKLKTSKQYVYTISSKLKKQARKDPIEPKRLPVKPQKLSFWGRIIKFFKGE